MTGKIVLGCLLMVLLLTASPAELIAQCAMCGASVESSEEGAQLAGGLNAGILYLLLVPYLLFAGFAVVIYRAMQTKRVGRSFVRTRSGT
jgi:hypothetical protein